MIKAIVADALGLHLDQFQRIIIDPASITVIRYTPGRPFLVRLNDSGGALASLVPRQAAPAATHAAKARGSAWRRLARIAASGAAVGSATRRWRTGSAKTRSEPAVRR